MQSISWVALLLVVVYSIERREANEIACPAGWVSSNGKFPGCLACPSGTYQNRPSNKVCNQCPPNTTTNETGATTMDQCYSMNATKGRACKPGTYSATGFSPCTPCSVGYYSTSPTSCKKCPSKRTTLLVGATHRKNCTKTKLLVSCPEGSISPSGYQSCSKCPIGYYQPFKSQRVCAKCPEGLSTKAEGAADCINITEVEKVKINETLTCSEVKYKKLGGVKLTRLNEQKGFFSSTDFPNNYDQNTVQQWKIHCFRGEYVGIIVTHMDLSDGDYLQVRDDRCSGNIHRPSSQIIRKNSAGVIFSGVNGNSSGFQCAFLCIDEFKRAWAESLLYNNDIMEIVKPVNDTSLVEKAIDMILQYPLSLFPGFNDPFKQKILNITFGNSQ